MRGGALHQPAGVKLLRKTAMRSQLPARPLPLDRKAFYDLAATLPAYAAELANHDQHRVNLKECHRFNGWLAHVKRFEPLAQRLATLRAARPVARWQIVTIMVVIWVLLALILPGRVNQQMYTVMIGSWLLTIVAAFFIPESVYGTTTELIEGKVLRVVDSLLQILNSGTMDFSEAAFYRTRENLLKAREELRLQIDLAHRPPNGPIL